MNVARGPQFREAFTPSALQDLAAEGFVERRGPRSFLEQAARENVSRVVAPNGEVIFNVGTSFSVNFGAVVRRLVRHCAGHFLRPQTDRFCSVHILSGLRACVKQCHRQVTWRLLFPLLAWVGDDHFGQL